MIYNNTIVGPLPEKFDLRDFKQKNFKCFSKNHQKKTESTISSERKIGQKRKLRD